jgi:hypothetical protein
VRSLPGQRFSSASLVPVGAVAGAVAGASAGGSIDEIETATLSLRTTLQAADPAQA